MLAEAGITKDARLRDARHTAGTLMGEQHAEVHVIQRILGHAQVTALRIYTEPTNQLTREAAALIGKALWPDAGKPQPELQPVRSLKGPIGTAQSPCGTADRLRSRRSLCGVTRELYVV